MIIEPPFLSQFPQTWIGSIYAPSDSAIEQTQIALSNKFPNITIINIKRTSQKVFGFLKTFLLSIKIGALMCFLLVLFYLYC